MQWCKRLGENETYYIHFVLFLILVVVDPSPTTPTTLTCRRKGQFSFNRRSRRSLRVMQWWGWVRIGENDTCCIMHYQAGAIAARLRGWGWEKNRIKRERKCHWNQSSEDLRRGYNCSLRRNISSQSWVSIQFYIEPWINSILFLVLHDQLYSKTNLQIVDCLVDNSVGLLLGVVSLMPSPKEIRR